MVGKLVLRGLLAGLIAGIVAFGFAFVYGEPSLDGAIVFEQQLAAAEPVVDHHAVPVADHHAMPETESAITRDTQKGIGLLTGMVVLGVGLGGLYSVLFAFANGRMGRLTSSQSALVLAAICFVTLALTPWLKYPANPPASTLDDTVGFRSALYFLMLILSIGLTVCAWLVRTQLLPRMGAWNATLATVIGYVVAALILASLMPTVNEVPDGFPVTVMWNFRVASIGIQVVLWSVLGLVFGVLVDRTAPEPARGHLVAGQ